MLWKMYRMKYRVNPTFSLRWATTIHALLKLFYIIIKFHYAIVSVASYCIEPIHSEEKPVAEYQNKVLYIFDKCHIIEIKLNIIIKICNLAV